MEMYLTAGTTRVVRIIFTKDVQKEFGIEGATLEFDVVKSGAFEYGNGTAVIMTGWLDNGRQIERQIFDSRYWRGTAWECFEQIIRDKRGENLYDIQFAYLGSRKVGDIIHLKRGDTDHECRITRVWNDGARDGVSVEPTGGYGFEIDIYEDEL